MVLQKRQIISKEAARNKLVSWFSNFVSWQGATNAHSLSSVIEERRSQGAKGKLWVSYFLPPPKDKRPALAWICGMLLLLAVLSSGSFIPQAAEIFPPGYLVSFGKNWGHTAILVLPALLATVILAGVVGGCQWGLQSLARILQRRYGRWQWPRLFSLLAQMTGWLPPLLSALPPFVSGIFLIRLARLDTIHSYNFAYGIICLAGFNVHYFYRRSRKALIDVAKAPFVLFARSLGLKERVIFRCYILPAVLRDHLVILRELLPHLLIESIVIEYTFSYNALLRSTVDNIIYRSPDYPGPFLANLAIFLYSLAMFLLFFDILFRWLENYFSPAG